MHLYEKYNSLFVGNEIDTPLRISHFMAQIEHESGLKPISENLSYSAVRLEIIFNKYFNSDLANKYAGHPEKIANKVYANRMGNGNEQSGDGWKYRGRGFIQITGKENYSNLSKDTGIDFTNNPDLLLEEPNAALSALWFWNEKNLNLFADKDDIKSITLRINGGLNGIEHRKELLLKWKKTLEI